LENYYIIGRERKTLRVPHIDKKGYYPEIDYVLCVGIYKWRGDPEAADYWSNLLRSIKRGSTEEAKKAGKVAAITLLQCISLETSIREEADLILPIPPDPERFKERKFNIPTLLSETISKYSSIPMFDDILVKNFSTEKRAPSFILNRALDIKKPEQIRGKNILIIDDITTHGHTFRTCGQKLKESGANQVFAAALAHSEPTSEW
jgi:predicted amidophosphoribosyltransferase